MYNLLAEGYRRLFKGKRFYIVMGVLGGIAIFRIILNYYASELVSGIFGELRFPVDSLIFSNLEIMPLFTAIVAGMLICRDFTNNTIRNKIITGHSRTNIYIANLIVSGSVALIYEVFYLVVLILLGIPIIGTDKFPNAVFFVNLLISIPLILSFTSIIVFLCMSMRNIGGAILSIAMHYVVSMGQIALLLIRNERLTKFLGEAVPSYQIDIIQNAYDTIPEHAIMLPVYTILISVVSTIGGILIFNKADIK